MIRIKQLCKTFNTGLPTETRALIDVNLHIDAGELVIFKGPNGSGKSTLLSLIAALSKPSSGEVIVGKQRISKLPDHFAALYRRQKIGFIFQKFHLIPALSVLDNVLVPLMPGRTSYADIRNRAETVMARFGIDHKQDVAVKYLSGGEQQRVAIARAMITAPEVLLADEPTANLDAVLSQTFLNRLNDIQKEGTTVLIATHDPVFDELKQPARVINMRDGRMV